VEIYSGCIVGKNSIIKRNSILKDRVLIGENVVIGENSFVDFDVLVRNNVNVGKNAFLGAKCIIGEYLMDEITSRKKLVHALKIGRNCILRSGTIIYGENQIGNDFRTGHHVTIRENTVIGNHVRIGTLSDIQGDCNIDDYVNLHSNVHIGQKSLIHKYVWIFPYVILTNDPNPPSNSLKGVTVEEFAVIATGSIILPGIVIGKESLVGAGSVVTKNVMEGRVYVGNPAKDRGDIRKVKDHVTGKDVYPWKYTFDRGMPWENLGYIRWKEEQKDEDSNE